MPRKTSSLATIISLIRHLAFSILTKLLQFILPIPLFPAVSSVLAQAFNIDPMTLSRLQLPHFFNIPLSSFVPLKLHMPPVKQELNTLRKDMAAMASAEETIPLVEKVRSWRAFNQAQGKVWAEQAERSRAELEGLTHGPMGQVVRNALEGTAGRKRIEHVQFNSAEDNPVVTETKSAIKEAKDSLDRLVPKIGLPPFFQPASPIASPTVPLSNRNPPPQKTASRRGMPVPERKEPSPEISDEEYARLSAEKQVFEKAKNRGKNPAVKKEVEEEMVSSSSASSVNLGPVAGEIATVPAPSPAPAPANAIGAIKDMHITGPFSIKRSGKKRKTKIPGLGGIGAGLPNPAAEMASAASKMFQFPGIGGGK